LVVNLFVTGKIEFCAAAIILLINANGGHRFGARNVSFNVTGSGSDIYDKIYLLLDDENLILRLLLNLQPKSNSTRVSVELYTRC
jgi:hypothetical protein